MIDLDAAKAARREVKKEVPNLVFGGRKFNLPTELPFEAIEELSKLEAAEKAKDSAEISRVIHAFVRMLTGDQYAAFMALQPTMEDLMVLFELVQREYGLGEASGSGKPSRNTSRPSKRTSKKSTA